MSTAILPQGYTPATAGFTCNSCAVRFVSADLQRQHMKTEWHRYNLKRRVSGLPLISSDVFAEKVLASHVSRNEGQDDEDEYGFHVNHRRRPGKGERQMTKKDLKQLARRGRIVEESDTEAPRGVSPSGSLASTFSLGVSEPYSEGEFDTGSELNYPESDDYYSGLDSGTEGLYASGSEDETDEEFEELPNLDCFYCGKSHSLIENNLRHMSSNHGLYIPERTYLKDLDGLLTFLNEVIYIDNECLTCGFVGKTLEGIIQHLVSKGHCRMPYETKGERAVFEEFYDFSLASAESTPASTSKKVTFSATPSSESYSAIDVEDLPNYTTTSQELTLPTGSRAMHRNVRQPRLSTSLVVREAPELTKTVALVDRRFAPGLTQREITRQEKAVQRFEQKSRNVSVRRLKTEKVNYQKHFRDELLQ